MTIYRVEKLEYDDSWGLLIGQEFRVYSIDTKTNMVIKDIANKSKFLVEKDKHDRWYVFEVEFDDFETKKDAMDYYNSCEFNIEYYNDIVISNVSKLNNFLNG